MANGAEAHSGKDVILAETLNDSSIDRVMAIDLHWNIIAWNKTSEVLSGHKKKDVIGRNLLDVFPAIREDEEMTAAIEQAFAGKKSFLPSNNDFANRTHIENHFIPLKTGEGKLIGVMNIMHDVAHRVKVERQLIRLNRALEKKYLQLEKANNDLATFTFVAGHDIKEPIRNVYTSLEVLIKKEGHLLSNMSRGNLRKMQGSLNRMNLLLDDILAISRIANLKEPFTRLDLNLTIESAKHGLSEKNNVPFTLNVGRMPTLLASEEMMTYLFRQLIANAIKFQPPGNLPIIDITCRVVNTQEGSDDTDAYYEICVKDNGIGFDPKDAERIFEMFTRLDKENYRGSGIGLTVCKRIVDMHDGMLSATARPGEGSTFRCYLPVEA